MKSSFFKALSVSVLCLSLTGCFPFLVGGVATASYLASQERGAKAALIDTKIKAHIKDKLTNEDYRLLTAVEVTVLEGDVLLTGVVKSSEQKGLVDRITRGIPDVKNVYNELFFDGVYSAKQYADDSLVATSVRGKLLAAKDVYSINYMVNVTNSVVYIMGVAETDSEKERVLHIVRTTKGVDRVVDFVKKKDDAKG